MSLFHYRAYNAAGETVQGAVEADSLGALENRLRTAGVWLLDARDAGTADLPAVGARRAGGVKRADVITFFIQMSLLMRAGITLPRALERMAEDFEGTRLGTVVTGLSEQIQIGVPLHRAMQAHPRVFSNQVVAMIQAGEAGGRIPEVFESLTRYYEWLDQLVGDIRQALIYPLIVTGAALALVLLLFTFVVPRFVTLLTDLSLEVPMLTRVVMAISGMLVGGWPVILGLAVGLPLALRFALRVPEFRARFDRALMRLPVFGPLVAMFALSRLTQNLGMLYRSGVTILKGLEICRALVGNRAIENAVDDVRKAVLEGTPMSKAMAGRDVFPNTLVTMISTGESSGNLDLALESVAQYYNTLIPRRIKTVFAIFNPAVMLTLIAVVGAVALSVILPILQLWQVR